MQIFSRRNLLALATGAALIGSFTLAGTALAAGPGIGHSARPAVVGTVTSIPNASGIFTVTAKGWKRPSTTGTPATPTVYTVTTASATTVTKAGVASTVSAIAVGDTVNVQGTVTGTNVVATRIIDGKMMGRIETSEKKPVVPATPIIVGNGQPVIGGNVIAISTDGKSLTVTNKSNVTYTVDMASATITKKGSTVATTSVAVGDSVIVQGAVNGTSVTASSVIDQGTLPTPEAHGNMMSAVGGFFSHLFGFF